METHTFVGLRDPLGLRSLNFCLWALDLSDDKQGVVKLGDGLFEVHPASL
jgi:hypothetical protein